MNGRPIFIQKDWLEASQSGQEDLFTCQSVINLALLTYGDIPRKMISMASSQNVPEALKSLKRALSLSSIEELRSQEIQEIAIESYSLLRLIGCSPEDSSLGFLAALIKDTFHKVMAGSEMEIGSLYTQISEDYSLVVANALCNMGLFGLDLSKSNGSGQKNTRHYIDSIGKPIEGRDQESFEAQILPLVVTFIELHRGKIAGYSLEDPKQLSLYRALLASRIDDVRTGQPNFLTLDYFSKHTPEKNVFIPKIL